MSAVPRLVHSVVGELVKVAERTPNLKTISRIDFSMCPWNTNSKSTNIYSDKADDMRCLFNVVDYSLIRRTLQSCPTAVCMHWKMWNTVAGEEIRDSNRKCMIGTVMKHDNSEPHVKIEFNDGEKLVLKGANLTWEEMMYHFNAFCHHKEEAAEGTPQKLF